MPARVAFSGLLKSGKDHISHQLGFKPVSFAEPLYKICEYVFGKCDKDNLRHRRLLQWLGQCGHNAFGDCEGCPDDFHKAAITILLRREGHAIWNHKNWNDFGRRADFWVTDLLDRVQNFHADDNVAVTNVRFRHELEPMKAGGFEHYLVVCSEKTRRARYWNDPSKSFIPIPKEIDSDISEQLARDLVNEMPSHRIIWNDDQPMPGQYLTVQDFLNLML